MRTPSYNYVRGETHYNHKLTADDIRSIRSEYDTGSISLAGLSAKYGVSRQQIHKIVKRLRWQHIE